MYPPLRLPKPTGRPLKRIGPLSLAVGLAAVGLAAVACDDDAANPVGDLSRPSGLLYVERPDNRGDLFIADSEVEGVRLLQFQLVNDRLFQAFALAPAVFSPLIIPTPGFPTQMAFASETDGSAPASDPPCKPAEEGAVRVSAHAGGRLYVLSAVGVSVDPISRDERVGFIHIVDARDTSRDAFPARGSNPGLESLGEIPLQQVLEPVEGPGLLLLPVGVKVLRSTAFEDILAVVFDSLDDQPGQAALLKVNYPREGRGPGVPSLIPGSRMKPVAQPPAGMAGAPAGGARAAAFVPATHTATPAAPAALIVPSARNRWVTTLLLADDLQSFVEPASPSVEVVDVGGPTRSAVAAGDRVVVDRIDRPSVVLLVRDGVGFRRDWRFYESPYTPSEERESWDRSRCAPSVPVDRLPDYCGRIDLPSPVSSTVYVEQYPNHLSNPDPPLQTTAGPAARRLCPVRSTGGSNEDDFKGIACRCDSVLFVVHTNGLASFLVRPAPAMPPTGEEPTFEVAVSSLARVTRTTPMTEASGFSGDQCKFTDPGLTRRAVCNLDRPPGEPCTNNPIELVPDVPVKYRAEFLGSIYRSRTGTLTWPTGSTPAPGLDLGDSSIAFEQLWDERLVRSGDRVRVQLSVPSTCSGGPKEVKDTGTVEGLEGSVLRVRFASQDGGGRDTGDMNGLAGVTCSETLERVVYEIWPGDRSAVLKQMAGERIVAPRERVAYRTVDDPTEGRLLVADFDRPLNITVTSTNTVAGPCAGGKLFPGYCETPSDCGPGRTCIPSMTTGCRAECSTQCTGGTAGSGCLEGENFRRCDGVELVLQPTRGAQISLRDPSAPPSEIVAAVPNDAVFRPLLSGFIVSSPGSRTLIQVLTSGNGSDGYVVDVTR